MYRMLNKEARAPLPAVHRAIRQFERSCSTELSRHELNRECIAILHEHNWRKCEYLRELKRQAARARYVQRIMCRRPRKP